MEQLTNQVAEKNKNSSNTQLTGKSPSQLDLSLSKNKNGSQMQVDKKSDSKINVNDPIPAHTANFGGKLLNADSVEDLDDSKKNQNPHEITFRPDQNTVKSMLDAKPLVIPNDEHVAELETQLKL